MLNNERSYREKYIFKKTHAKWNNITNKWDEPIPSQSIISSPSYTSNGLTKHSRDKETDIMHHYSPQTLRKQPKERIPSLQILSPQSFDDKMIKLSPLELFRKNYKYKIVKV